MRPGIRTTTNRKYKSLLVKYVLLSVIEATTRNARPEASAANQWSRIQELKTSDGQYWQEVSDPWS
eukprot:scaffold22432_cov168-Amphora_coffeaeformis.AAC.21